MELVQTPPTSQAEMSPIMKQFQWRGHSHHQHAYDGRRLYFSKGDHFTIIAMAGKEQFLSKGILTGKKQQIFRKMNLRMPE